MERYANGDADAFTEVYDAIAPRLLRYLRKATRDEAATEDLMQQIFLQMHRARGTFIPGASVMPWTLAIAKRLMIDRARRRRIEVRLFSQALTDDARTIEATAALVTADDTLQARRLEQRVQQRLATLPETQRTAFRLVQQEGLSLKSAAEVLHTSVTAVKLRTHRAYVALRTVLREEVE